MPRMSNRTPATTLAPAKATKATTRKAAPKAAPAPAPAPTPTPIPAPDAAATALAILATEWTTALAAAREGGSVSTVIAEPVARALRNVRGGDATRQATLAELVYSTQDDAITTGNMALAQTARDLRVAVAAALPTVSTRQPVVVDPIPGAVALVTRAAQLRYALELAETARDAAVAALTPEQVSEVDRMAHAARPDMTDPDAVAAWVTLAVRPFRVKGATGDGGASGAPRAIRPKDLAVIANGPLTYTFKGTTHKAALKDGTIRTADGQTFDSPTKAAVHVTGQAAVNGWVVWRTADGRTLDQQRG